LFARNSILQTAEKRKKHEKQRESPILEVLAGQLAPNTSTYLNAEELSIKVTFREKFREEPGMQKGL